MSDDDTCQHGTPWAARCDQCDEERSESSFAAPAGSVALLEYLNDEIQRAEDRLTIYRRKRMRYPFHFTNGQLDALLGVRKWLERKMPPNEGAKERCL